MSAPHGLRERERDWTSNESVGRAVADSCGPLDACIGRSTLIRESYAPSESEGAAPRKMLRTIYDRTEAWDALLQLWPHNDSSLRRSDSTPPFAPDERASDSSRRTESFERRPSGCRLVAPARASWIGPKRGDGGRRTRRCRRLTRGPRCRASRLSSCAKRVRREENAR